MLLEAGAEPDVKEQHDELGREMATEIGSASYIYIYIISNIYIHRYIDHITYLLYMVYCIYGQAGGAARGSLF
jgi:hypothetical protein